MKIQLKAAIATLAITGLLTHTSGAADSTTQTVSYEVQAINEIAVSASPAALVVSTATAGEAPDAETDSSTTYDLTTNETGQKITGSINTDMPSGTTLSVTLGAPTGATSTGKKSLSTVATDLVTGISTLNETGKAIEYELSTTSAAGVVAPASKTVTLTITAGA